MYTYIKTVRGHTADQKFKSDTRTYRDRKAVIHCRTPKGTRGCLHALICLPGIEKMLGVFMMVNTHGMIS